MYLGAIYALLTLLIIAVVYCQIGWLHYSPFALVASSATLIGVALVVNWLTGYILGRKTHYQSAIITGLILTFIFTPSTTPSGYVVLALVSTLAMLSKHFVIWRCRHLFNPAAFGATVLLLSGIGSASWWVAASSLLLPVIVLGTFLLYRTGRLQMGYIYIVTALVTTVIVTALQGVHITPQLVFILIASYPILFLAYFMLSEPLTQAPRRLQRNVIAAGVAVIASAQLSFGPVFITPEIALLFGNLAAFFFSQRRAVLLTFSRSDKLAADQMAYYFIPDHTLNYEAGQYLELSLYHKKSDMRGQRRMFTIASAPSSSEVRIIVRNRQPLSTYKMALSGLKKGDRLSATGIYGDFVLPHDVRQKLLFIAGGIGITPFLAQFEQLRSTEEKRDIILMYLVNDKKEAVAMEELRAAQEVGVTVHILTERISTDLVRQHAPDALVRHAYISGPPVMVDAARRVLKRAHVRSITADQFDGY